jgi:hypothetical protein
MNVPLNSDNSEQKSALRTGGVSLRQEGRLDREGPGSTFLEKNQTPATTPSLSPPTITEQGVIGGQARLEDWGVPVEYFGGWLAQKKNS